MFSVVEFISLDAMWRLVRPAGWSKKDVLKAIDNRQLAALKVKTPSGLDKIAILHPGIEFIEFVNNPIARIAHAPLLSQKEVAVILDRSEQFVRWLVHKKRLKAEHVDHRKRQGLRFTPEAVRQYMLWKGRDPKQKAEPTSDDLVAWFWRVMKINSEPLEVIDEDLAQIDNLPEPERSQRIEAMMRLAEEARDKLIAQCEAEQTQRACDPARVKG